MKQIRHIKRRTYLLLTAVTAVLLLFTLSVFGEGESVTVVNNGPRLTSKAEGISGSLSYQWSIAETADGEYSVIAGADGEYYDITEADENKFIKVSVNGVESAAFGPIGKLIVMDIGKGSITLSSTYSGKSSDGTTVSGTHTGSNLYVIVHANNSVKTTNNISFSGNFPNDPFDLTLAGVNMGVEIPTNTNQQPGVTGSGTPEGGNISIPATSGNTKKVTIRLKGENILRNITYYVMKGDSSSPISTDSSLKFTDINGDGAVSGSLYVPVKLAADEIEAFVETKRNYNHWNAAIGGLDGPSQVQNLHIAGGKLQVVTTLGDNCTAIGAGGNGYCQMEISGGEVIAHCNGTGAAIGGGIGWQAAGGVSNVLITGGKVYAKNHSEIQNGTETVGGVAIGAGSSFQAAGSEGAVTIEGGEVEAYGTFGNGIGGGNSSSSTGGSATITISGGKVTATSIGGGNSKKGVGGEASVTVSGSADVTLLDGIGGGLSQYGSGGEASITVEGGTMNCNGVIGGGNGTATSESNTYGHGGAASITVRGGMLTALSIGGGIGGTDGNGGKAEINVEGGTIITGSIGGGSTTNPTGKLGHAVANISGGDISGQFIMAAGGAEPCSFTMTGGTLYGVNTADNTTYQYAKKNGAAVYMDDPNGRVEISGGTIRDCSAENGGAVYMTAGTFTLSGGTITHCTAEQDGGGVYLGGGSMYVTAGMLTENRAQNGGGAFVKASTEEDGVTVSGGSITKNVAQLHGGGIAVNNGYYKMTGGAVDQNTATTGHGGGIYVSTDGVNVSVDIRSGSVSNNTAGINGGAVAVVGEEIDSNTITITVTVGVDQPHFDADGNPIVCDHGDDDDPATVIAECPCIRSNLAATYGGGIYITGSDETYLNVYCLEESGNLAADGKQTPDGTSKSNFMMVDGGTVLLSTAETGEGNAESKIVIESSIHIYAGDMTLSGSMSNPMILGSIAVDVTEESGSFTDNRKEDGKFFKLQYFENFKDAGRYTIFQVPYGESATILPALYKNDGYMIDGWWTDPFGDVEGSVEYLVNETYVFTNQPPENPGSLILYAKWLPVGYYVNFEVGTTDPYRGEMEEIRYNYDDENTLPANAFFRQGWLFVGWSYEGMEGEPLADQAVVKNLTEERSITLTAEWALCHHEEELLQYTLSGTDTITRTCFCEACTQTATLYAEDTVYVDGNTVPYEAELHVVSNVKNGTEPAEWGITPTYTGVHHDGSDIPEERFLIDAGNYSVSITERELTATVSFLIDKADQSAPETPEYTPPADGGAGKIFVTDPNDQTGKVLFYRLVWYDESSTIHESFADLTTATETGFDLPTNYTNYYVYVCYEGDVNHHPSEWVRADSVLFYEGNVYIYISAPGMEYVTSSIPNQRGLQITISPMEGYYLYDVTYTDDNQDAYITTVTERSVYHVNNIPEATGGSSIQIHIAFSGAKKQISVSSTLTGGGVFGKVEGSTAIITGDSAYTTYFEIRNYDVYSKPKWVFGSAIPAGTSVILLDKTSGTAVYYAYTAESATAEIGLQKFLRMGTEGEYLVLPATPYETVLKYQLIIDFSNSAGFDGATLTTAFSAERTESAIEKGVPEFPNVGVLTTELRAEAEGSILVSDAASGESTKKELEISYLQVKNGVVASKWSGRHGALVLTPKSALPEDAHIEIIDGALLRTVYYRNADGQFIVDIGDAQENTLQVTLLSALFPEEETTYLFDVSLYSARSATGRSPINGTLLSTVENVAFTKAESVEEPSLRIESAQTVYRVGDTVTVNVSYLNLPENSMLVLRLLGKDVSNGLTGNVYIDTGWTNRTDVVEGENQVPLGNELVGSCCILLEIKNTLGDVLMSVPFYFVVYGN